MVEGEEGGEVVTGGSSDGGKGELTMHVERRDEERT